MENKVVSNTGPLIHLREICLTKALDIFDRVIIPPEVRSEIKDDEFSDYLKKIKIINLDSKWKDIANALMNQFSLDLGEAEAIALALQERVNYFLTDDLDARTVANIYNLEVHGTIGIVLRAFKENLLKKNEAIGKIKELYEKSSLFITRDIVEYVIKEIEMFRRYNF